MKPYDTDKEALQMKLYFDPMDPARVFDEKGNTVDVKLCDISPAGLRDEDWRRFVEAFEGTEMGGYIREKTTSPPETLVRAAFPPGARMSRGFEYACRIFVDEVIEAIHSGFRETSPRVVASTLGGLSHLKDLVPAFAGKVSEKLH